MKDTDTRFHDEWLGLAQPIEGLVFSIPVLADAQIAPKVRPAITAAFSAHIEDTAHGPALRDARALWEGFLGYDQPGMLVGRAALPAEVSFYAPEGRQEIRPSFALARGPFAADDDDPFAAFDAPDDQGHGVGPGMTDSAGARAPYIALVWDLGDDAGRDLAPSLDLDRNEDSTGPWRYPPTAKLERLLRHVGVPVGFVTNRRELRLVYAPAGEATSHLTFRVADLAEPAGRPLLAALELLFHARRTYTASHDFTFEGLLAESRRRQADVTKDLAEQVFEAVEILLEGFEHAAARDCVGDRPNWLGEALEEEDHDHFYQGVLSVVLRLVFLLYAEDQGLVPVGHSFYARHLSVMGLYEELAEDAGAHPESMHHRFGAYGRLLALFRAVYLGARHRDLVLPPRRGRLFDPSEYPFLEGGLSHWTSAITVPEERAEARPPSIDDGTIHRVLHRLVVFAGQRLSYATLDVEQIGSVYESLMGYHVLRLKSPAVRLGKHKVWVESGGLRDMSATDRKRFLKEECGLGPGPIKQVTAALRAAGDHDAAPDTTLIDALAALSPGRKHDRGRHRAAADRLVLQPGDERRRTGSHYTPRTLTEKVVRRTLEPILACLGEAPAAEQILMLKVCDPAMGSGAFLVAACRHLAEAVVAAWTRAGEVARVAEEHGDAHLHARRLVAQRCLYGVDKNPAAVELAKLSLWLVTLSKELPFTFVDHALRHGDSLVGLDLDQIRAFHWKPKKQLELCKDLLEDALAQALEHRDEILALAEKEDPASQRQKERLLEHADLATKRVRMVADVCVGAFFAESKNAREAERVRRLAVVDAYLRGDESKAPQLEAWAAEFRARHAPFHWMIEFPEVFYQERPDPLQGMARNGAAFMEAFVGNPPFLAKAAVIESGGHEYIHWLLALHESSHGAADIVAHFFRRAGHLLGEHGTIGLLATNTVAQGDTRETGLKQLLQQGFCIYDAVASMPWPGAAAVNVAVINLAIGSPVAAHPQRRLGGRPVEAINSRLLGKPERTDPSVLNANKAFRFLGPKAYGAGFILSPEEHEALQHSDIRNAERMFPYLGGEEVNSSPTQSHRRHVIYFSQMSLSEAEQWPDLLKIVRDRVKPERDQARETTADGAHRKKYWWQFAQPRPELFRSLAGLERCLVNSQVSKHLVFAFQPTDRIFAHTLYAYPLQSYTAFAVLQSRVHEPWARLLSSSMKTDLRYSPSDCFDNFPFPASDPRTVIDAVEAAGQALYEARAQLMLDTDQGLTKTYNALKDPDCTDPRIEDLRGLHQAMDRAVLDAYGWKDLEVSPFCPRTAAEQQALRAFEDEVIDRLYVLNAERAAADERLGLRPGKGRKQAKKSAADDNQGKLL